MSDLGAGHIPIRPLSASPRTSQRPMAFTSLEFILGVWVAFLAFNAVLFLSVLGSGVLTNVSEGRPIFDGMAMMFTLTLFSLPISGLVFATYGWLAALGLGRFLAREPRKWVHRIAYLGLGFASGYLSSLVLVELTLGYPTEGAPERFLNPLHFWCAVTAALAALAGWEFASRRALRKNPATGTVVAATTTA